MIRKILNILLAITFVAYPLPSQAIVGIPDNIHWVPAGYGAAGTFSMIVPDRFVAGKVYSAPDVNAPYVTNDRGEHWQPLAYSSPGVNKYGPTQTGMLIQSKISSNILYAMDSSTNGLYKSIDFGATWGKLSSFRTTKPGKYVAVSYTNDNDLYASSIDNGSTVPGGRVWQSQNAGVTWAQLFRPFDIAINETAELTGSTNTRTGRLNSLSNILKGSVVFTSEGGETFTDNGSGILVSNMGGSGTIKYANINTTQGANAYGNYTLVFGTTPSATTVSYTISPNSTFVYLNKAGTYVFVGRGAASGTTFVRYTIADGTITPITLTGTNASYLEDFATYTDSSNVEHFCVTAGLRIACSSDDGDNWTYTSAVSSLTTWRIKRLGARMKADGTVTFVVNRELISNAFQSARHVSSNDGVTWQGAGISNNAVDNPTAVFTTGTPRLYSINPDPFDENIWYMSSDWRMWRSDNGGVSFAEKVHGAQNQVMTDVTISPNGRIFSVGMDVGIAYSDDLGENWVQATPSIAKGQPYVTGGLSDYGGHYWRVMTLGTKQEWDNGQGVVLATATMYGGATPLYYVNYVVKSINNGVTWTRSTNGLPTVGLYGDVIWDRGYMRAMGKSADESLIYVGVDGENCDADGSGGLPGDSCAANGNNHAFGGLFVSADKGDTWKQIWYTPRKIYNAIAVDPTDPTGKKLMFGTFGYNMYQRREIKNESAELNGSDLIRTGTLNNQATVPGSIVFTTASTGETFTDNGFGALTSNMGGSGTVSYSNSQYTLVFGSTVATTTATYSIKAYVGSSEGPGDFIYEVRYESQGRPYAATSNSGPRIYRAEQTVYSTKDNPMGGYGTWKQMKKFGSSGTLDGLLIHPSNNNHIFVSSTLGTPDSRRVWVTVTAQNGANSIWHDITGDFPIVGGCQSLAIKEDEGPQGTLYCASNGGGIWKLNLQDSVEVLDGVVSIGE